MIYLKRTARLILFAAGLFFLLRGASHIFMPKNNMSEFGMEEVNANGILGEKKNTIEAVVLGDSESYSSISPMQIWKDTGYTAYVCGTSAQTLDYSTELLKRTFENQKPRIVILETNAVYRDISGSQAAIFRLGKLFSVFQYHNRWKSAGWNDLTGRTEFTWTDDCKGYRFISSVNPASASGYMSPSSECAEIPRICLEFVHEIHDMCRQNGAELLFLSTPSTVNWNSRKHNGIAGLAEEMGVSYIDLNMMNDRVGIDWNRDTRDKGDHLNHSGAEKVTGFLSEYLSSRGILTDQRGNENYRSWEEALQRYEALVAGEKNSLFLPKA